MKKRRNIIASISAIAIMFSSMISVGAATYYDCHDYETKTSDNLKAQRTGEYYVSSNDYIIGRLKIRSADNTRRYSYGKISISYKNIWNNWKKDTETETEAYKYVTKSTVNEITTCEELGWLTACPDNWTSKYKVNFTFRKG